MSRLLFLLSIVIISGAQKNNVCKTYSGYLRMSSSKSCYYSPDMYASVPEISARHTGVTETHYVMTKDGYNLTLFRIPRENPKGVIVMKHASLFTDSNVWVNQENRSLALILWEKEYDIWLTNERGTKYCKTHEKLTIKDRQFWNYTINEIGLYDVKANLDYIKQTTGGQKLIVLDHSTGFSSTLIYASERPQEASDNIKLVIAMGPVAFLEGMNPIINFVAYSEPIYRLYIRLTGRHSVLTYNKRNAELINNKFPFKFLLTLFKSLALGFTPFELEPRFINLMYSELPSGTSWKNGIHFCQIVRNRGKFQKYDYGKKKNRLYYNADKPPLYKLENVKVPLFLIYSKDDYISTERNIKTLRQKLPSEANVYEPIKVTGINHLDFQYGKHAYERVYKHIFDMLDKQAQ